MVFRKSFHLCAFDESSLSIGSVNFRLFLVPVFQSGIGTGDEGCFKKP